jgi:hypothetical protein
VNLDLGGLFGMVEGDDSGVVPDAAAVARSHALPFLERSHSCPPLREKKVGSRTREIQL